MVVIDSSVWIDFFNAKDTLQTNLLDRLLDNFEIEIILPDVILAEILRGFRFEREYENAKKIMLAFKSPALGGAQYAIEAAEHYRALRTHGITVRKFVDVWIATFCIQQNLPLLYADKDFDGFVQYRGLLTYAKTSLN